MSVEESAAGRHVVGGVDTHKDLHVAAVVDERDRPLATASFATTRQGYRQMLAWMRSFGTVKRVGIESTSSYGAGLLRFMQQAGIEVLEVTAPDRNDRRRRGKNDNFFTAMNVRQNAAYVNVSDRSAAASGWEERCRMTNPFVRKLENLTRLSDEQRRILAHLTGRVRHFGSHDTIVGEGDEPDLVNIVLSGWACRYKALPDGRRQITALLLPGDMCDPYVSLHRTRDHALGTLTPGTLAKVPAQAIRDLTASGPELAEALWWQMLEAAQIQREWIVSLGRRTAIERLAHLFCEVSTRLSGLGLTTGQDCDMPLTQSDLADAIGVSPVHVNRSLKDLRGSGLIELRRKRLTIHDRPGLMNLAMFDPTYLRRLD